MDFGASLGAKMESKSMKNDDEKMTTTKMAIKTHRGTYETAWGGVNHSSREVGSKVGRIDWM